MTARGEFADIRDGELHIKNQADLTAKSAGELRKLTEAEDDKAEVYANVQKITGWLASIEEGTKKTGAERLLIIKEQKKLDNELARKKQAAEEAFAKAKSGAEEQQSHLKELLKSLEEARLPHLRKERSGCRTQ